MESANPACQMEANVITKDTVQSQKPSDPTLLCPQSNVSEHVRAVGALCSPKRNPLTACRHNC